MRYLSLSSSVMLLATLLLARPLFAEEWFESVKLQKDDYFGLGPYHAATSDEEIRILGNLGEWKIGSRSIPNDEIWVRLTKEQLRAVEEQNGATVLKETVLTDEQAAFWRDYFNRKADDLDDAGKLIAAIPGVVIPAAKAVQAGVWIVRGLTATTTGWAWMVDQSDTIEVTARTLSADTVKGGRFRHYAAIKRDSEQRPYLHLNLFYEVTKEEQPTHYLLHSSRYAVEVTESQ